MAANRPFRARTLCAVLLLASYVCFAVAAVQDLNEKPKDPKVDTPPFSQIYADGSFFEPWRDASVGCKSCNFEDSSNNRNGSAASASVQVQPWGALTIASTKREVADSVLDFWAKGSGLTAISLFIKDTDSKTLSRDVRFQRANQVQDGVTILGNDDDGFIHIQVALDALRATDNSTHDGTDSCGTGVSQHFDRIVFADISGMGFTLVLDDVKLISADIVKASAFFLPTLSMLPPVFGDDLLNLKSARNRYTIKLKPNVTHDAISMICQELRGQALHPRRFSGMCNTPLKLLRSDTGSKLSWDLVTLTVQSPDDLKAMRDALKDHIEWFEADLTGFTSIRALHDAVNKGIKSDVSNQGIAGWREDDDWQGGHKAELTPEQQKAAQKRIEDEMQKGGGRIVSVSSWGLDRINQVDLPLDGSYSSGDFDGRGVHVYVLDTGLRPTHFEFRGRVGAGASAVGGSIDDDQGHGTHVSGTAVGSVHGVAPGATLHPVKVMDAQGNGAFSNIIAGIQWAKDHKVKNSYASAVISMSIAGPRSAALNDAVEAAVAAGITVVAAAGNNRGGDSCTMSPSSAPSAITVGASTDTDAMASMSNIGTCLSLFAPGAYIASAGFKSDTDEVYMSGTSMAAPHVAGAAALYLQYRPGAPASEVRAALMKAAVGRYFETSSPKLLLNVMSSRLRAAQEAVAPTPKPAPKPSPSPKPVPKPSPSPAAKPVVKTVPSPSPKPVVKPSPSPAPKPAAPVPAAPIPVFKPLTFGDLLNARLRASGADDVPKVSKDSKVNCCALKTCQAYPGCWA